MDVPVGWDSFTTLVGYTGVSPKHLAGMVTTKYRGNLSNFRRIKNEKTRDCAYFYYEGTWKYLKKWIGYYNEVRLTIRGII
jgi:hypothetical protein